MKNSFVAVLLFTSIVSSFFLVKKYAFVSTSSNYTLSSAFFDHPGIALVQKKIKPLIDGIIEQECNVAAHLNYPDFILKKSPSLTLYYLEGCNAHDESAILEALDSMQEAGKGKHIPQSLALSSHAAFFGDKKDELVIFIDDPFQSLLSLHNDIRDAIVSMHDLYAGQYGNYLFNKERSERYSYAAHIVLGTLQSEKLKSIPLISSDILERIKSRIEKEVFPRISSFLSKENREVVIKGYCLYDLRNRWCVKKYKLL